MEMSSYSNNDFNGFILSPTVMGAIQELKGKSVSATIFTKEISKNHNEFVGKQLTSLSLQETPQRKTAEDWLRGVAALFDVENIRKISQTTDQVLLHGRLVIVGLCLLEPELRRQLEQNDIFFSLIKEIKEPFDKIVTDLGRTLYKKFSKNEILDSVPSQPDNPVQSVEKDLLGRVAFARYLAKRISTVPDNSGAYSILIHGVWGSGKSSLLNFIRKELEDKNKWLVIEFNAWRHQHIRPSWWSLMECVFRGTKHRLSWLKLFREYWWRLCTGRIHYLIGLTAVAWMLAFCVYPIWTNPSKGLMYDLAKNAANFSKVIALLLTIWGIVIASSRSLLLGSAKAAQSYVELTHDPMNKIRDRFNGLIKRLEPIQVAVFIDDLDRCQSGYVVELLEGIQTLCRDAPVVFVVASDRYWLNACYEETYEKFKLMDNEPGKHLGTLFLEKVFQFTAPVPGVPEEIKISYWQSLIQLEKPGVRNFASLKKNAKIIMDNAPNEAAILSLLKDNTAQSFEEQMAIREEAVVRLATPEIVQRTEHTLQHFVDRLDANPRSMKRLVNAYSVNRALAILSRVEIEREHLARWTILSLRWPRLSEYLEKNPNFTDKVGKKVEGLLGDMKEFWKDKNVIDIIQGVRGEKPLTSDIVRMCARLRG